MLFVELTNRTHTTGVRVRTLQRWSIKDWGNGEYSIQGFVASGSEEGDGEAIRFTTTSPIQCRVGDNVVITASGSSYTLLEPAKEQDPAQVLELFENRGA